MHRTLIVAKIRPGAEQRVAEIFAKSDQTELPHIAGVRRRSLYRLGDLYAHLLETEDLGDEAVAEARRHPYRPSGREPLMYADSRRGIPYHARGENQRARPHGTCRTC